MTVGDIIKSVRWCIDEEDSNPSSLVDSGVLGSDNSLMDNIIKDKIGDAVRWICLYAPAELLGGSDEMDGTTPISTGILVDATPIAPTAIPSTNGGYIDLPSEFIKLARVRVTGWHRSVKVPISEDSDEYLQLRDDSGAMATADRPQAVIIDKAAKQLEVWPTGTTADYTYVADIDNAIKERTVGTSTEEYVALPPRVKTAFIYYLAFLLLSAYEDSRAARMLDIAKMNIGKN